MYIERLIEKICTANGIDDASWEDEIRESHRGAAVLKEIIRVLLLNDKLVELERVIKRYNICPPRFAVEDSDLFKIREYEGLFYSARGENEIAVEIFKEIAPDLKNDKDFWYNFAIICERSGRLDRGITCLFNSLEIDNKNPKAQQVLGQLFQDKGDDILAIHYFEKCLQCGGGSDEVKEACAISFLREGAYENGWRLFEYRKKSWNLDWLNSDWTYGEGVKGKTVVVIADEGVGDVIMFGALLPELMKDARDHVVYCDPRLRRLLKRTFPECNIEDEILDMRFREYDCRIRLASLGGLYWKDTKSIKDISGYLKVCEKKTNMWKECLGSDPSKVYVGIAWEGGAHDTKEKKRKSLELKEWRELLEQEDVCWISLQHSADQGELNDIVRHGGIDIKHYKGLTEDIDELAALINGLDLVICCEQTVAHIAGGVGCRAIVLTGDPYGWRYKTRDNSNSTWMWYEKVSLIPKTDPGKWDYCRKVIHETREKRAATKDPTGDKRC